MGFFWRLYQRICKLLQRLYFQIVLELKMYAIGARAVSEDIVLRKRNKCDIIDKTGQIAVVTGGARGIGKHIVKKLLKCNMHVIIGCRNVDQGLEAVNEIRAEGITSGICDVKELDLASFRSIRKFAVIVSNHVKHLNLLVNNAGIMFVPYKMTVDGFESHWAVNYLGPFLLTHHLLPLMTKKEVAEGRIVNVTSCAHEAIDNIDILNINSREKYNPTVAYASSKLAQILYTQYLDRLLRALHSQVYVYSVHPGIVNTELFDNTLMKRLFPWFMRLMFKDADQGAESIFFACVSPQIKCKGGVYLSNCRIKRSSPVCTNKRLQYQLFTYSCDCCDIYEYGRYE